MKKILLFPMLIIFASVTFSQQTKSSPSMTKQDYFAKSKKQKNTALIFLSGGVAVGAISTIIALNKSDEGYLYFGDLVGVCGIVASVPFFNASANNKRKGMSLSFRNEKTLQIQKGGFVCRSIPSLTLKITL